MHKDSLGMHKDSLGRIPHRSVKRYETYSIERC